MINNIGKSLVHSRPHHNTLVELRRSMPVQCSTSNWKCLPISHGIEWLIRTLKLEATFWLWIPYLLSANYIISYVHYEETQCLLIFICPHWMSLLHILIRINLLLHVMLKARERWPLPSMNVEAKLATPNPFVINLSLFLHTGIKTATLHAMVIGSGASNHMSNHKAPLI